MNLEHLIISAFQSAARQAPFYKHILEQFGIDPARICNLDDFQSRVPVIDKKMTFGSFPVSELCRHGQIGSPASLLTSSGHSGLFAFGIYDADSAQGEIDLIDDALDMLFNVRRKKTLLINCLPMGVQVFSRACTLAHTSVRADMVTALVSQFAPLYEQIILVGEAAFIKHVLELGRSQAIDWQKLLIHIIVGEEPLAENARKYLENLVGIDINQPQTGFIGSSMGVAELGLNLFFELPELVRLRRFLHENPEPRKAIFGKSATIVPPLFVYNPQRIFVEVLQDSELVLSTLNPRCPIPLIRYRTGDMALILPPEIISRFLPAADIAAPPVEQLPIVAVKGRGEAILSGDVLVYPEEIKEGIYHDPRLAGMTTANFRLRSGKKRGLLRIQLSPNIPAAADLSQKFSDAISSYITADLEVKCQTYETFNDGMTLDYERKFSYIDKNAE